MWVGLQPWLLSSMFQICNLSGYTTGNIIYIGTNDEVESSSFFYMEKS